MRWRPRFSLLSLLLLSVTLGCAALLWQHWAPWRVERTLPITNVYSQRLTPDLRWLLNGTDTWDLQTGEKISSFKGGPGDNEVVPNGGIKSTALSLDGRRAASYGSNESLRIWDTQSGDLLESREFKGWNENLAFSSDGASLLAGKTLVKLGGAAEEMVFGRQILGTACFFDKASQDAYDNEMKRQIVLAGKAEKLKDYVTAAPDHYMQVFGSPSGKILLTSIDESNSIQIWDWLSEAKRADIPLKLTLLNKILFFPNDERIAIEQAAEDGKKTTQIVALADGKVIASFQSEINDWGQSISGDFNRIVLTLPDNGSAWARCNYCIYEIASGRQLGSITTSFGSTQCLSNDGQRFAAIVEDGSEVQPICIFDANTGTPLTTLSYHQPHGFGLLRFDKDGNTLITDSEESILFWRRHRPEQWWGVAALPEFWAAVVSLSLLVWSLRRDWKLLKVTRNSI